MYMPHFKDLCKLTSSAALAPSSDFTSASHLIVGIGPGIIPSHFLTRVSLAAGRPKEDGRHSEFDKIKDKDASRAGNERGYRIFFLHSILSLSSKHSQVAFERVSDPTHCYGRIKTRVLRDMFILSVNVTGLTPDFINGNFLPKGYESR